MIVGLSSEEIVKTVSQLLEDQNLYNSLKENAEKAGRVLTWENEEGRVAKIFDNFSRVTNP